MKESLKKLRDKLTDADLVALRGLVNYARALGRDPVKGVYVLSHFRWFRLMEAGLALASPPRLTADAVALVEEQKQETPK